MSSHHRSSRVQQSSYRQNHNQSMGWIGELSSMVLSMGHKLISGASDSCSEVHRVGPIDNDYKPQDMAQLEQLYKPVEPGNLISRQ